ncbi:MAG: SUMF1/EgtB/PvdO family nonheme iron enzyme [Planctomycetota bacterium]
MGRELEILAGLMAVQLRLVPGPRFIHAGAQTESDPTKLLTRRLVEERDIGEAEMASILMLASGQVRQHGGDETAALASAPIDPKLLDALLECGPSPKMKGLLRLLRPAEKVGTSVLPGHAPKLSLIDTSELDDVLGGGEVDLEQELRGARPMGGGLAIPASIPAPTAESAEADDVRRVERALKTYADSLAAAQGQKGFHARGMTRGVSESNVTALGSDQSATREARQKAATLFEGLRKTIEEAVARRPANRAIRHAAAEFYTRAASQREIEGEAAASSELKARARLLDTSVHSAVRRSGTLGVRTRAFSCACVREGREFAPGALALRGLSLFTGLPAVKSPSKVPGDSGESDRPVRLKAHGPECVPAPLPGADVWLFRYDLGTDHSTLTTPKDVAGRGTDPLPVHLREALFAKNSPHAPEGPGVHLGKTPVEGLVLPSGSWMLLVWQAGRNPARVPVRTGVSGDTSIDVTLSLPTEVPPKFASIAEGTFLYQGDVKNPHSEPGQSGSTHEFLLAKYPVTAREYAEFLNARCQAELDLVVRRSAPRDVEKATTLWPGPPFAVPTAQALEAAPAEFRAAAKKLPGCTADWNERWPIVSISWRDAMMFCEWKRATTGWLMTLPHEIDWEKAARGVDGRTFPWGHGLKQGNCNTVSARPDSASPSAVEEFPADESPYGVFGLGGNARDMCLNQPGPEFAGQRVMRGGYWASDGLRCHSSYRTCARQDHVSANGGFRLMCITRLS